ncbi:MAG TPA: peptidyl-prolyl cis-trans isomerase, partial [Thermoleophilaceae bacterium]|nr:peptidyl-prolyl cis-trans isomerase [Thermoleophilaceae bacterium]
MLQRARKIQRGARRPHAALPGVGLTVVLATAIFAGCGGDDLSPNSVARVGDATIERSEFDRWLAAAARSQQTTAAPGQPAEVGVPEPPDFAECVESRREQAQEAADQAAGGGAQPAPPVPSEEELRQQCEQAYELLKEQVMQFLLQAEALEQEAEARGISVSDEEVQARFEDLKQAQGFPSDQEFQQSLEQSGMTEEDLLYRVRLDLLIELIRDDVLDEGAEVTDEEIAEYYEENKNEPPIGQPEQREVKLIVTETEEEAEAARQALEGGGNFAQVAKKFSIDSASRRRGGKLTVQEGAEEGAFDEAVFDAEPGELVGPVETELGFYVFEVTDVQPARSQSLEEASEAITEILRQEQQQEVLADFQESFEERVREKTTCAEGFVVPGCGNGPDPEEEPEPDVPETPPSVPPEGAPPGGAPPGGAPPAEPAPQDL